MATPLFKFRLSDDERCLWQEQADHCEVSLSEWIRDCCNDRLTRCVDTDGLTVETYKAVSVAAAPSRRTMAHPGNCRCLMCQISRGEIK